MTDDDCSLTTDLMLMAFPDRQLSPDNWTILSAAMSATIDLIQEYAEEDAEVLTVFFQALTAGVKGQTKEKKEKKEKKKNESFPKYSLVDCPFCSGSHLKLPTKETPNLHKLDIGIQRVNALLATPQWSGSGVVREELETEVKQIGKGLSPRKYKKEVFVISHPSGAVARINGDVCEVTAV